MSTSNSSSSSSRQVCIECGSPVDHVYKRFSEGTIRLTVCSNCKQFADRYVEFELVLIILDLILHNPQAYRHLLFNRIRYQETGINTQLLKLGFVAVLLDSYIKYRILREHYSIQNSVQADLFNIIQGPLTSIPIGIVLFSTFEFGLYLISIILASHFIIKRPLMREAERNNNNSNNSNSYNGIGSNSAAQILNSRGDFLRNNYLIMAILLSSFGYTGYILMMIWDFPTTFVWLVTIFTLSSNTIALKVFFETTAIRASIVVAISFLIRKLLLLGLSVFDSNLALFI